MIVLIENYRGFDIEFNSEKELFVSSLNENKSFSLVKKEIDEHIKKNQNFEPFDLFSISMFTHKNITITGIRKDNKFTYETNGKKEILSVCEEKDYFLSVPENNHIFDQLKKLDEEKEKILKQQEKLKSELIKKPLSEIKKKYII